MMMLLLLVQSILFSAFRGLDIGANYIIHEGNGKEKMHGRNRTSGT